MIAADRCFIGFTPAFINVIIFAIFKWSACSRTDTHTKIQGATTTIIRFATFARASETAVVAIETADSQIVESLQLFFSSLSLMSLNPVKVLTHNLT